MENYRSQFQQAMDSSNYEWAEQAMEAVWTLGGDVSWMANILDNRVDNFKYLDLEAKQLISTVASEAIGENSLSRKAVANVIINRTKERSITIKEVVSAPYQFSGYGQEIFNAAMDYMDNRTYNNSLYEQLIADVMPVYYGYEQDITRGSTHFYSPRSMNPPGREPDWFKSYEEIYVEGIDPWHFRFAR